MARQLILIPPSEGKATGGTGAPWEPGSMAVDLDDRRVEVIAALRRAMRGRVAERERLLGVGGSTLAAATRADREVRASPTLPAIERYTGVLYGELDAGGLPAAARRRLDAGVLVVSGLWGLVAPQDPLPEYRLKMGARLDPFGRLATWWRPVLGDAVAARAEGAVVWDLLPAEHAAAVRLPPDQVRVTVRFLEPGRGGKLVAVSHWNKLLKGALVDRLVRRPVADPSELEDWVHPRGFRLDPRRTRRSDGTTHLEFVARP